MNTGFVFLLVGLLVTTLVCGIFNALYAYMEKRNAKIKGTPLPLSDVLKTGAEKAAKAGGT